MEHTITCQWQDDMRFDAEVNGHTIILDAKEEVGGRDQGPRPKPLLLTALAGCTGMDVVSILKKMKVPFNYFNILVNGSLTDEHPKYYYKIHLSYEFKEEEQLDKTKVEKAVRLSQEKYCGVSELLRRAIDLSYEIKYI